MRAHGDVSLFTANSPMEGVHNLVLGGSLPFQLGSVLIRNSTGITIEQLRTGRVTVDSAIGISITGT